MHQQKISITLIKGNIITISLVIVWNNTKKMIAFLKGQKITSRKNAHPVAKRKSMLYQSH